MNWYVVAQHRFSGFSAEAISAELSRLRTVASAQDRRRLKRLILTLLLGGAAGWGLNDLVDEIAKRTGLDRSEAVEVVEEVAQESMEARIALQEAEGRPGGEPGGATGGYDIDAFYRTLEDYEGSRNTVYNDDRGNPTIGIGHLVRPEDGFDENTKLTRGQIRQLFEQDVRQHIARAERLVPEFPNLPVYLQKEILASIFRGGLSGSPDTVRLMNEGSWREAADEFLDNNEYRRRLRAGGDGVTRRMENLRDAVLQYANQ